MALEVAGAEHCGLPVDAGLVRSKLIENQTARGLPAAQVDSSGRAFDKTRSEFKRKLAGDRDFCQSEFDPVASHTASYEQGWFPGTP